MKNKVFCINCEYLRPYDPSMNYLCGHKDNIEVTVTSDWFQENKIYKYISKPEDINRNNDCKWYCAKPLTRKMYIRKY